MIEGVKITPLKQFPDERGKIMRMMNSNDPHFTKFGDMSFSIAFPGVVKGWHKRKTMTSNIAVPFGRVKWVLYDGREDSSTKGEVMEIFLGEDNYNLLTVPPGITSGYKTYGTTHSIVANCTDEAHDDGGKINIDPFNNDIPYDWNLKHR